MSHVSLLTNAETCATVQLCAAKSRQVIRVFQKRSEKSIRQNRERTPYSLLSN